jgi:hypothetical protein
MPPIESMAKGSNPREMNRLSSRNISLWAMWLGW